MSIRFLTCSRCCWHPAERVLTSDLSLNSFIKWNFLWSITISWSKHDSKEFLTNLKTFHVLVRSECSPCGMLSRCSTRNELKSTVASSEDQKQGQWHECQWRLLSIVYICYVGCCSHSQIRQRKGEMAVTSEYPTWAPQDPNVFDFRNFEKWGYSKIGTTSYWKSRFWHCFKLLFISQRHLEAITFNVY